MEARTRSASRSGAGALCLMLLPALALGAWGWKSRPRGSSGPSRIVVRGVEHEALSPRDVAQGFDTRVKVTLGYEGDRPRGWGEGQEAQYSLTGSQIPHIERVLGSKRRPERRPRALSDSYEAASDAYKATYVLRLCDVVGTEPVEMASHFTSLEHKPGNLVSDDVPELTWRAVVRQASEKTRLVPRVSHFCPLKLSKIEFFDGRRPGSTGQFCVEMTCELAPALVDDNPALGKLRLSMDDVYLKGKQGHRWKNMAYSPANSTPPESGTIRFYDWDRGTLLPKNLDGFTFRALISIGDSWPLEVRVPVRGVHYPQVLEASSGAGKAVKSPV